MCYLFVDQAPYHIDPCHVHLSNRKMTLMERSGKKRRNIFNRMDTRTIFIRSGEVQIQIKQKTALHKKRMNGHIKIQLQYYT